VGHHQPIGFLWVFLETPCLATEDPCFAMRLFQLARLALLPAPLAAQVGVHVCSENLTLPEMNATQDNTRYYVPEIHRNSRSM